MPDKPTTALIKAAHSPVLARVSNQLALTDKLLTKPEEPFLIPYRLKAGYAPDSSGWGFENYWAFCDKDRKIVLEKYYNVQPFVNGFARIEDFLYYEDDMKEHYGYINKDGDLVIPPNLYRYADNFSEGLAKVSRSPINTPNFKLGFIDKSGNEVVPCIYDSGKDFSQGLCAVCRIKTYEYFHNENYFYDYKNFWGFINNLGEVVIPLIYENVSSFSDGLAVASAGYNKWGYIDKTGQVIITLQYMEAKSFSENLAAVRTDNYDWGFISNIGNEIIPFIYEEVLSFSEGLAAIKRGDKWGFINKIGEEVIPCTYEAANSFSQGFAGVRLGPDWMFISKSGNLLCSQYYEDVSMFSEDRAGVKMNSKWGFINKLGELIIPAKYDRVAPFSGKISEVTFKGEYPSVYIGREGTEYWEY